MTLNIGGGFSLLRWASSMVSSLCCAMPPDYAPPSTPESDKFRACPFPQAFAMRSLVRPLAILRTIVIFVGGRSNAAGSAERPNYGVFSRPWLIRDSGLALAPHSPGGSLDGPLPGA